jgi:hypothetical protein
MNKKKTKEKNSKYFLYPVKNLSGKINIQKIIDIKAIPGWLIKKSGTGSDEIEEWRFSGLQEKDNVKYLYGEKFSGISLLELLSKPPVQALKKIKKLISAINLLKAKLDVEIELQLDSIYFLDTSEVLILPYDIIRKIKEFNINADILKNHYQINHPYLEKSSEKISYSILMLVYRILTGKFAFEGKTEEEISSEIRLVKFTPPNFLKPELKSGISDTISRQLKNEIYKKTDLAEWIKMIDEWLAKGLYNKISEKEKKGILLKSKMVLEKNNLFFNTVRFLEKNLIRIAVGAGITAAVLVIVFFVYSLTYRTRFTKGYSPYQVIEAYYMSMNKLEHEKMQDCVISDAGKTDINMAITLYLNSKIIETYEYKTFIMPVDDWDKKGRPDLGPNETVFGVLNLKITEVKSGPDPVFTASYEKWEPNFSAGNTGADVTENEKKFNTFEKKEKLYLTRFRGYWVINKIETLEQKKSL